MKPMNVPLTPAPSLCAASSDDAGRGDRRADKVVTLQPVALERDGEPDREKHLKLDHERRESRRHSELHSQEQQAELEHADRESVADHVAPRDRRTDG